MRKKKSDKKIKPLFVIISTLVGLAVFIASVGIFAVWVAKNDTDSEYYFIFLVISAFIGSLIAAFVTSKRIKSRRFFAALGQGSLNGLLNFAVIATFNSFSFSPLLYVVIAVGSASGIVSGLITSNIR